MQSSAEIHACLAPTVVVIVVNASFSAHADPVVKQEVKRAVKRLRQAYAAAEQRSADAALDANHTEVLKQIAALQQQAHGTDATQPQLNNGKGPKKRVYAPPAQLPQTSGWRHSTVSEQVPRSHALCHSATRYLWLPARASPHQQSCIGCKHRCSSSCRLDETNQSDTHSLIAGRHPHAHVLS